MAKLLCFAHGVEGDWEAICIDLDIAVQGRSYDEVYGSLMGALRTYFEDAQAENEPDRRRLLDRRAPWYVRLAYVSRFVMTTVLSRDRESAHGFTTPCTV